MVEFKESKFYKLLQDFFINNNKETFLQMLGEFYNRTEGILEKDDVQDELIKELRKLYIEFNEKGIDENIVIEKVNYFVENNVKIKDILAKLVINTNKIEDNTEKLAINTSNIENIFSQMDTIESDNNKVTTLCKSDENLDVVLNSLIKSSDGTKILVPSGNYIINDTIQILKNNIHLVFSQGCTITTTFHNKNAIWIGHNVNNITIENLNIIGIANRDNEDWCISVGENSNNIKFINNRLSNFSGGIMLTRKNYNIIFDGNSFINMKFPTNLNPNGTAGKTTGGYGIVYQSSHDIITVNNYFKNIDRHCLYVGRDPANGSLIGYNHTISNNLFLMENKEQYITTYEYAVKVMGNKNVTVSNNIFDGGVGHLWLVASGENNIQPQNISINGNVFRNISKGNSTSSCAIGSASNINMTTIVENCVISGNTIMDCDCLSAIKFDVLTNTLISNNTIKNISRHGVLIEYGIKDSMINNNIIYNVERGIMLKSTENFGDDCDIKNNQIKECQFGIWLDGIRYSNITSNNIITNAYNSIILNSGCFEGNINNNSFDGGNCGLAIKTTNTIDFYCYDNVFGSHKSRNIENSTVRLLKPFFTTSGRKQKCFTASEIPTDGTWIEGDRMYYEIPGGGGYEGAVCTKSGTPGTWKNFGAILS